MRAVAPFRIDPDGLSSIGDVLNVMELRVAVEVESAALAAERAKGWQIAAIMKSLADVDAAIDSGDSAVREDFAFHRAIADATMNPQLVSSWLSSGSMQSRDTASARPSATPAEQHS